MPLPPAPSVPGLALKRAADMGISQRSAEFHVSPKADSFSRL